MDNARFTAEFESLVEGYLEGQMTAPECARLQALLKAEPALVAPILSGLRMEALLRLEVSMPAVPEAAWPSHSAVPAGRPRVKSWMAMAACLALFVALLVLAARHLGPVDSPKPMVPVGRSANIGILCELWRNVPGTAVSDLTSFPDFPLHPNESGRLPQFEAGSNGDQNYGARVRGYLHPTASGEYTFGIASDDQAELWLSPDDNPAGKVRIARVVAWSEPRDWFRDPGQRSGPIPLQAGRRYYIEALHKQGAGSDCLAVAWEGPDRPLEVIPGKFLSPPNDRP